MSQVGDLGRRVAERRRELAFSIDTVAGRAAMDPSYLRMLEDSSSPEPTRAALCRLAAALQTSMEELSGGGTQRPPGHGSPGARLELVVLMPTECQELIASGGVGRVVFSDTRGPVALPVNFRMLGSDVVLRTEASPSPLAGLDQRLLSFEVDHLDEALTEGWSVLITGVAHVVTDPVERQTIEDLGVSPWAGGDKDTYIRIVANRVTGRRIRHE